MATGGARAKKTDPELWEKVKDRVTRGDKGGEPGQWSARKAQLAVSEYKKEGGGYEGGKSRSNHLSQWTKEEWGTKSGKESGETGERYLPKKARESLTDEEYARTTKAKRSDAAKGKQFSKQPEDVARKTAKARDTGKTTATDKKGGTAAKKAPAKRKAASPATVKAGKAKTGKAKAPAKKAASRKTEGKAAE